MRIRDPIALFALAMLAGNAAAQPGEVALTCTNPWSGTTWQITIDYRTPAVDRNLAQLSADWISWFEPKDGGNWTLNRKSGELVGRVASSTGGYFLRGRCALEASHGR